MYRPDEMALILEQARQYTNSQQLAHTENKTISIAPDDAIYFFNKASDTPIEITQENLVSLSSTTGTATAEQVVVHRFQPGITFVSPPEDLESAFVISVDYGATLEDLTTGVWFLQDIHSITTKEIHPIPQEYIPPLDRLILNGADGNQYALTITDGAISVAPVTT